MKFLSLILASFTQRFEGVISSSMNNIVQELVNRSRKALLVVIASLVFALLLPAGIIISILEASAQFDTRGVVYMSALLVSGTLMWTISLAALTFILWPRSKPMTKPMFQTPPPPRSTPLEDSISSLINQAVEFLKERKEASQHGEAPPKTSRTSSEEGSHANGQDNSFPPQAHQHFNRPTAN